ncbi:hypothetical protein [Lysinibacillus fusiformis]|uniref:hypothetical protein n=1 Tax=Lysinibacillus fusiformis TaxID=28031 RepID=UPI00119CE266|nr:hypothetical protein [Lysinibacillus fusiformis]
MKNFLISFLSIVIGVTVGTLIINYNKIDITNRVVLFLILILGIALLIILLYLYYKNKSDN